MKYKSTCRVSDSVTAHRKSVYCMIIIFPTEKLAVCPNMYIVIFPLEFCFVFGIFLIREYKHRVRIRKCGQTILDLYTRQ